MLTSFLKGCGDGDGQIHHHARLATQGPVLRGVEQHSIDPAAEPAHGNGMTVTAVGHGAYRLGCHARRQREVELRPHNLVCIFDADRQLDVAGLCRDIGHLQHVPLLCLCTHTH